MAIFKNKLLNQILKFGLVGGMAFVIDYALLYLCTEFLHIHYLLSSIISFTISVIFNYILSIKWVFDVKKKQDVRDFVVFIILSVIGLGINSLIMYVMVEVFGVYYMLSKIVSTVVVMVYNFITRKIFVEK
jgi:putative flippase GtrA